MAPHGLGPGNRVAGAGLIDIRIVSLLSIVLSLVTLMPSGTVVFW